MPPSQAGMVPSALPAFSAPRGVRSLPRRAASLAEISAVNGMTSVTIEGQTIELDQEDIQVRLQAREGWAAAQGPSCVVVLNTQLTDELIQEGIANDVNRCVQECRKEINCAHTDRIHVAVVAESEAVVAAPWVLVQQRDPRPGTP